jgi:Protein of unknown function (DUF3522)
MPFFSHGNEYDIFTIITNFLLLIPAAEAWSQGFRGKHKNYFLLVVASIFFVETFVSLLYHLCKSFDLCLGWGFFKWFEADHFFATSMIWLATVFLLYIPQWAQILLTALGMLIIACILGVTESLHMSAGTPIAVFATVALGLFLLVYLPWFACFHQGRLPPYNWVPLCIATTLLTFSTTLFTIQNYWVGGYWAVHALWHSIAAFGWAYLLLVKPFTEHDGRVYPHLDTPLIFMVPRIKHNRRGL